MFGAVLCLNFEKVKYSIRKMTLLVRIELCECYVSITKHEPEKNVQFIQDSSFYFSEVDDLQNQC